MKVELEQEIANDGTFWTVRCFECFGNRWEDRLGWDEALGVIATILLGQEPKYLKTKEEHDATNRILAALKRKS